VAQLAARGSHNPKVVGSTPTGGILIVTFALVAQLAALRSYEPMAQGSSPCRSIFSPPYSTQRGWMAEWSKALVLGTSLSGGVGSNPTPVSFASVMMWGISSIGRVRRSQRRGTGIETRILHFCRSGRQAPRERGKAWPRQDSCCAPIV
jgi:hypothetical protein